MEKARWVIPTGALLYMLCLPVPSSAMTITLVDGTVQNATSVTDTVTSIDMVGVLTLTATFLDGSSDTVTWGSIPDPCGGACPGYRGVQPSSGWSLIGSGNTLAMLWQYDQGTALAITSLTLSGTNLAFDLSSPSPGTTGSLGGQSFSPDTDMDGLSDDPDWSVIYSNAISLNGAAPIGDLYGTLTINFGVGGYSGDFRFLQDTDFYTPGPGGGGGTVPDPSSSLLLLGISVATMAAKRYRRN